MSHVATFNVDIEKIKAEELLKTIECKTSNFRKEVKDSINKKYGLNDIRSLLEEQMENSEVNYRKITTKLESLNKLLNSIDEYMVYNMRLNIIDYNEQVNNSALNFIKNDVSILEEALSGIESNIKRKYILQEFANHSYQSSKSLLENVETLLEDSAQYEEEQVEANLKKLETIKDTKFISPSSITKLNENKDKEQIDYNVRNRVLKNIFEIVRKQGFIIKKENLISKEDALYFRAYKVSGEKVEFKINLSGKFAYKFHNYEGMSCEKDIDNFEMMMNKVYGMKISDKQITWSNPDRLGKMAHQTYKTIGGH